MWGSHHRKMVYRSNRGDGRFEKKRQDAVFTATCGVPDASEQFADSEPAK
jgi:hypothetical protein